MEPEEANQSPSAASDPQTATDWNLDRMLNSSPVRLPSIDRLPDAGPPPRTEATRIEAGEAENIGSLDPVALRSGSVDAIPLRWAGKLFFKKPAGDYNCSAQFVTPRVS